MTHVTRTALITGASSGLGAEFALQLADHCDQILLTGRNQAALAELAEKLQQKGLKSRFTVADLTTTIGVAQLVETIRQQGPLDYLVNNAGFSTIGPYIEQHPATQQAMVNLHIYATMQLTLAALGGMTERRSGKIINVSSLAAFAPFASITVYSGTKAFLNNFSVALQQEVEAQGIKVQCLCPGYTRTGFQKTEYFADFDPASIPEEYWMEAADVVKESLAALRRDNSPVVFVAGDLNRALAKKALQQLLDQL
jgi:short-subunit dehydrogenase